VLLASLVLFLVFLVLLYGVVPNVAEEAAEAYRTASLVALTGAALGVIVATAIAPRR
jgi:hypothetical protein